MSQELLNKASQKLTLGAVFLKKSEILINDDFIGQDNLEKQSFKGVQACRIDKIEQDDQEQYLYKFVYSVGVRLVDTSMDDEDSGFQKALIEADFEAHYLSEIELEEDCLQAFGEFNVGYHVWPYWREYVQSTCMRSGIVLISIPLYNIQVSSNY
tara:strand:+ start:19721 stop:20185 length:465 start_codon:yes stop_codon:yes gene_type:complete